MALWAVLAAPLIMSNDLRTIAPQFTNILTNRNVIKINQDPLGHQGRRVKKANDVDIFVKNIMPTFKEQHSHAVAVMYRYCHVYDVEYNFKLSHFNLEESGEPQLKSHSPRNPWVLLTKGVMSCLKFLLGRIEAKLKLLTKSSFMSIQVVRPTQQSNYFTNF